jgi:hypothetical protein
VTAWFAQSVFGPMIAARVVAEMPPAPAIEVALLVSTEFFADAAVYLDPRRLRDMVVGLPVQLVVDTAREMVRRREFATMSRFVDYVTDEQTRAVIDAIEDEAAILRIAFYMGSKNRIDHLFQTLSEDRLERMIVRVEEERGELLPAFLSVLIHVSYALKRRLGDIIAAQDESVLSGYVRAAQELGMWVDVLPVVGGMSERATRKVVNLPVLAEREVQESIIRTADDDGLWGLVLSLVAMMDDSNRNAVASIVAAMSKDTLRRASDAALMGELWSTLLDLARRMPESKQAELASIVRELGAVDPELVARIAAGAEAIGMAFDQAASESRTGVSASSAYS